MRKKFSVALVALLGLTLFACGKKTDTKPTDTKPTQTDSSEIVVKKYTVTVVNSIQGAGTISGIGEIEEGKSTTIKAVANDGYTFLGFYDGETCVSENAEYTITVSKNVSLTARWTAKTYNLTVKTFSNVDPANIVEFTDDSLGTVTYVDEHDGVYSTGEVITLTATPATGYQFNGWYLEDVQEGDHLISPDATYDFHMLPQTTTIKALFGTKKCTYEIVPNIEGAMPITETGFYDGTEYWYLDEVDSITVDYGTTVTIFSENYSGYNFQGFYVYREDGDYSTSTLLPTNFEFNAEDSCKYVAWFTANDYDLNINFNIAGGTVTAIFAEDDSETYTGNETIAVAFNSTFTLKAEAFDGYTFIGWYSDPEMENLITDSAEYAYTQTVTTESGIWAKFAPNKVKINFIVPEEMADMCKSITESAEFDFDSEVTFTATPEKGYVFLGWYVTYTDEETGETEDVKVSADGENTMTYEVDSEDEQTFIAKFELGKYSGCGHINLEDLADYSSDVCSYTDKEFVYGSEVTFVAPEIPGYTFKGWYLGEFYGKEYEEVDSTAFLNAGATYTFNWYYAEEDFTEDGVVCFTAVYDRNLYKVEYIYSDGVQIENDITWVKFGLKTQLELPTYTGYAFQYWYYNSDVPGEGQIILTNANAMMLQPYSVTGNLTLRAKWLDGKVIASFETDGGTEIDDVEVQYNHPITKPTDPEKEGYTFVGWYNVDGQEWVFNQPIVENTTLYAHWTINQYEITISSQDDSILVVDDSINGVYDFNTGLKLTAIIETGYTFDGWFDGENIISTDLIYDYNIPAKNVELVAKFHINQHNVTVKLYKYMSYVDLSDFAITGGGTYDYGSTITITTTFNNEIGMIQYYRTNMNGSWEYVKNGTSYVTTNPYTFVLGDNDVEFQVYVHYKYKTLSVKKNVTEGTAPYYTWNTGSSHYTSIGIYYKSPCHLFAYEIEGYNFVGWYNGETLLSTELENVLFTMPYENVTLTAKYEPIEYVLTINKNVDDHIESTEAITNIDSADVAYHDTFELSTTNMTGYTFLGWFIPGENTPLSTDLTYGYEMPHDDVTVEARYVINSYMLYTEMYISNTDFNLTPGSINVGDSSSYEYDYNVEVEYVATTNDGWTFLGYYGYAGGYHDFDRTELANGVYTLLSSNAEYTFTMIDDDYIIYPVWKANTYILQYYANGGTIPGGSVGAEVLFGDEFTLAVPTKTGETFTGWYYAKGLNKIYLTDETGASLNYFDYPFTGEALSIQAEYGVTLHTVTFNTGYDESTYDANDTKTYTIKVPYGSKVPAQDVPTRKGYEFNGWFTEEEGGTQWTFDTNTILEDTTLYAHWTVNQYTIQLRMGSTGTNMAKFTYYVNSTINGTVSNTTGVTLTLDYGTIITLDTTLYLGRRVYSWTYNDGTSWKHVSYEEDFDLTFNYAQDIALACNITYVDEMKYFNFTSTTTSCNITSLTANGINATNLVVPDYVTEITAGAFAGNNVLTSITLPFIGLTRTSTATDGKVFVTIFGTISGDGLTARSSYYTSSGQATARTTRYVPTTLKTVIITDETSVADYGLYKLDLNKIQLNEGITSIGRNGLSSNNIFSANIDLLFPSTLQTIGEYAFGSVSTSTINITVPSFVTYIGKGAFGGLKVTSITLPFVGSSYTGTGTEALFGWITTGYSSSSYLVTQKYGTADTDTISWYISTYIKEIIINPTSNTYVPKYGAFMGMDKVERITINYLGSTCKIADHMFDGDVALVELNGTIVDKIIQVCEKAFYNCSALEQEFSGAINTVNMSAFENSGITAFSTTVQIIVYGSAFKNCANLATIELQNQNGATVWTNAFVGCTSLEEFEISTMVVGTGSNLGVKELFKGCTSLKSFKATTISFITDSMFEGCSKLETVNFAFASSGAKVVGDSAFKNCASLKYITIPNDTEAIDENIFAGCSALYSVTLPYIGMDHNATVSANYAAYNADYTFGRLFGIEEQSTDYFYASATASSSHKVYYIPTTLKIVIVTKVNNVIPAYSFYGIKINTFKVTGMESSVYQIGDYAFRNSRISTVEFASGLTKVGRYAFYDLWISKLTLPDTVNYIASYAFARNTMSGQTLVLPSNSNLELETYSFSLNSFSTVVINKFKTINSHTFYNCSSLVSVQFNYGTTTSTFGTVKENAFYGCTKAELEISYYGTKAQLTPILANNFASGWNVITPASGSTAAVAIHAIKCTDGDLEI